MKERIKILLLGKGGRESALARKILESPRTERLYMAPAAIEGAEAVAVDPLNFQGVADAVEKLEIDMVVPVGAAPIVAGITDWLEETGVKVIAPSEACARLEGSKEFAKEFMADNAIPTARFMTVTSDTLEEGLSFLDSLRPPYVLKADGLAMGKGVLIINSLADAKDTLTDMIEGMFDEASETVLIEEYIDGRECTVTLAVDGEDWLMLPVAHDYKRNLSGNIGPNTPGMGSVSPVSFVDADFMDKVKKRVIRPTLRGLKEAQLDYRGFLYLGLMELDGEPVLVEYNVRLGDPETQAILPRIKGDFVDILEGIADRTVGLKKIQFYPIACAAVVLTAEGFPGTVRRGDIVTGILEAEAEGCKVYPGQLSYDDNGKIYTDGGRVLTVTATAPTMAEAAAKATSGASAIVFDGAYFRDDIGRDVEEDAAI